MHVLQLCALRVLGCVLHSNASFLSLLSGQKSISQFSHYVLNREVGQ